MSFKDISCEIIGEEDLSPLLGRGHVKVFDGFEPSGDLHLAQGLLRIVNTKKLQSHGCKMMILIADVHAMMNNKGDMNKIRDNGYRMIETWEMHGMKNVDYVWASDFINDTDYLKYVFRIMKDASIPRLLRCTPIMGRVNPDDLKGAHLMYPAMQAADFFYFNNIDIIQMGVDQRKVNVFIRELCDEYLEPKPVVMSHALMPSLKGPDNKMSKSDPDSAIFMNDTADDIKRKISNSWCPKGDTNNAAYDIMNRIIFEYHDTVVFDRSPKFGGELEVSKEEFIKAWAVDGEIHPSDLKETVSTYLIDIVD